ncbi:hypothetical protein CPC08DRAFT_343365 [Agrocybe pediades]|nr:hypothetical protein CPC08DRAFT_343365 [Agrocybe pediades]
MLVLILLPYHIQGSCYPQNPVDSVISIFKRYYSPHSAFGSSTLSVLLRRTLDTESCSFIFFFPEFWSHSFDDHSIPYLLRRSGFCGVRPIQPCISQYFSVSSSPFPACCARFSLTEIHTVHRLDTRRSRRHMLFRTHPRLLYLCVSLCSALYRDGIHSLLHVLIQLNSCRE